MAGLSFTALRNSAQAGKTPSSRAPSKARSHPRPCRRPRQRASGGAPHMRREPHTCAPPVPPSVCCITGTLYRPRLKFIEVFCVLVGYTTMRGRHSPIDALTRLASVDDSEQRRTCWRQALAALGEYGRVERPPPLDGLPPGLLLKAA